VKRLWQAVIDARGSDRIYCFPFLLVLKIVTPLYQLFSRRKLSRRHRQCSREWGARVISVGNITVGGSGKTPIVLYLAERCLSRGDKVAIVHSGYGRSCTEDIVIDYGKGAEYTVACIGDETAMMAGLLPQAAFVVGRDKKRLTIRLDRELAPDIILIDDGYQRRDIAKEVDIVAVNPSILDIDDGDEAPGPRRLFPAGVLREPLMALSRADAVFVVSTKPVSPAILEPAIKRYNDGAVVITWSFSLAGAYVAGKDVSLDDLRQRRPFLFAGIGSYARLKRMLTDAGIAVFGDYDFGDHHDYGAADVRLLARLAAGADCYLTTAKDLVKLPAEALDKPICCLRLLAQPDDPGRVDRLVRGEA
jgi:tetraacyldisaccharide 4'-kinase